jgi:hypothetical protein
VPVQDQPRADFASDPECRLGCHIEQLPENIVVSVGPSQKSQQESPNDEHERKLNQTLSDHNGKQHGTFLTYVKVNFSDSMN